MAASPIGETKHESNCVHQHGIPCRHGVIDGVYPTDFKLLLNSGITRGKYVETNPDLAGIWRITRHMTFQGAINGFVSGVFLQKTFVAGGFGFYLATFLYRFWAFPLELAWLARNWYYQKG